MKKNSLKFLLLCALVSSFFFSEIILAGEPGSKVISEDFENYSLPESGGLLIEGNENWTKCIYGAKTGARVTYADAFGRAGQLLDSPDLKNHHDNFVPDYDTFQAIMAGPVAVIEFKAFRRVHVNVGVAQLKNLPGIDVAIIKDKIVLTAGKKRITAPGLGVKTWHQIRLIIVRNEKKPDLVKVTVAVRPLEEGKEFKVVEGLDSIDLDLSKLSIKMWTGLSIRLVGRSALDDIKISACADIKDALKK